MQRTVARLSLRGVGAESGLDPHTTNTLCFAFSDLLDHPEYLKPLREELVNVYNDVGEWNKATLANLRLMDSFIKESQRYHPMRECRSTMYIHQKALLTSDSVMS